MKSLKFFFAAVCLIGAADACSSSNDGNGSGDEPGETPLLQKYPEPGEVKVMSFNVRYGSASETDPRNNWDFRKAACVELIRDQKPSVIGFQEAVYDTQWAYFKTELAAEYDGFGVGREDGVQKGECMGILYRRADVEKIAGGTFWLSQTPDTPSKGWDANNVRTATWGLFRMKATGKTFCYINTHLDHKGATARARSMELLLAKFAECNPDRYPQLLTADFNTVADDPIFAELKKSMALARLSAPRDHTDNLGTYNAWGSKSSTIDHIFHTASLTVKEYHTVAERYGSAAYVSDHYPIYAILKL